MYSTCLFCHEKLGANEVVEHFPVGRRLAFDASKGRLWVICTHCGRWNLTPEEERWEAMEECERHFRATRLQVSTENIGLARLAEGLELVRIGPALRTELASWRYGRQFGHRRKRQIALTAGGVAVGGALLWAGPAAGLLAGGSLMTGNMAIQAASVYYRSFRTALRIDDEQGQRVNVTLSHLLLAELIPSERADEWTLVVPHKRPGFAWSPKLWLAEMLSAYAQPGEDAELRLTGEAAVRAAGQMLPKLNRYGGSPRQVRAAVGMIEAAGDPTRVFGAVAKLSPNWWKKWYVSQSRALHLLPAPARLALEMAAHEETEREALESELKLLQAAWREAEEIAAIADSLLLPESVQRMLDRLRGKDLPM